MRRVLIIEDEKDIAQLVELHLRDNGYDVTLTHEGPVGLELAEKEPFDLVILDLMLPGMDGIEICQRLRRSSRYVPVLMLTARSTELDRVLGLEVGADDYLTKPFSVRELVARVKAMFRRVDALGQASPGGDDANEERLVNGDLTIEISKRRVTKRGEVLRLTAKEFDLLLQFARNPGRVYTRTDLLDQVWGYGHDGYEHTVNSHINRLRAKIEADPANPTFVQTVWGVGYRFSDAEETN